MCIAASHFQHRQLHKDSMQPCLPPLFFFLFLLFSTSSTLSASRPFLCHQNEAAALLDIKRSIGNPPSLYSWDDSSDCCNWDGVRCDPNTGSVNYLYIDSHDASGTICPSIARLSSLLTLSISDSNITGTIPPVIGNLNRLTFLGIYNNPRLTGTIPASLCTLQNLTDLFLAANDLFGPIPDCFYGKTLAVINLSHNRLSGPIPANIMTGLTATADPYPRLVLSDNELTGPVPLALGDVPLKFINLSSNRLTGDASFLFRRMGSLEELYLSENELEFDTSNVKFPLRLVVLKLNNNRIYGRIPRQISKLRRLTVLDLSYNRLCGPVPTAGIMKKFGASSFEHNECLCGGPLEPCG